MLTRFPGEKEIFKNVSPQDEHSPDKRATIRKLRGIGKN